MQHPRPDTPPLLEHHNFQPNDFGDGGDPPHPPSYPLLPAPATPPPLPPQLPEYELTFHDDGHDSEDNGDNDDNDVNDEDQAELKLPPDATVPALPPLQPPRAEDGSAPAVAAPPPAEAVRAGVASPAAAPTAKPPALIKAYKTAVTLKTDLAKASRDGHPCGILHCLRLAGPTEEHAFAWIAHHENGAHLQKTLDHVAGFGFSADDVIFIPFTSRRSWVEKYPVRSWEKDLSFLQRCDCFLVIGMFEFRWTNLQLGQLRDIKISNN